MTVTIVSSIADPARKRPQAAMGQTSQRYSESAAKATEAVIVNQTRALWTCFGFSMSFRRTLRISRGAKRRRLNSCVRQLTDPAHLVSRYHPSTLAAFEGVGVAGG